MTSESQLPSDGLPEDQRAATLAAIVDEIQDLVQSGKSFQIQDFLQRLPGDEKLVREVLETLKLLGLYGEVSVESSRLPNAVGDYEIYEEVGRGGMGIVYRARQISLDRTVALKILPLAASLDRKCLERFRIETHSASILQHPNILAIYGTGCEQGVHYYAMQYISGKSLQDHLKSGTLFAIRTVVEWIRVVADALQHAHELGVVHRDIKPSNLMIDDAGKIWITDFGLAQIDDQATLTLSGDFVGTLRYMSPEQALGGHTPIDHRTDIYALGATLFELLTGQPIIDGQGRMEILKQVLEKETSFSKTSRPIPRDLQTIVFKATAKERDMRYGSAAAMAEDLLRYLEHRPILASRPGVATKILKLAARHPAASLSIASIPILILIGLFSYNMVISSQKREVERALKIAQRNENQALVEARKAKVVSDVLQQLVASANPDQTKGAEYTVRQLLDDLSQSILDQLEDQPEVEVMLRSTIGNAYRRLGSPERALDHLQRVFEYHRSQNVDTLKTAQSQTDLAWSYAAMGKYEQASDYAKQSVAMLSETQHPHAAIQAMWCLQHCLIYHLNYSEADEVGQHAAELARQVQPPPPELANIIHELAQSKTRQGKVSEGLRYAQEAVDLHRQLHGEGHPELGWGFEALGRAYMASGEYARAAESFEKALKIFEAHYPAQHKSILMSVDLLESSLQQGDQSESLHALQKDRFRKIWEPLVSLSSVGELSLLQHLVKMGHLPAAAEIIVSFPEAFVAPLDACAALEILTQASNQLRSQETVEVFSAYRTRWKPAVQVLVDQAVNGCGEDATTCNTVAWYLSVSSDPFFQFPLEALTLAKKANALKPDEGAIWNTLGLTYLRSGDLENALAALRKSQEYATSDEYDLVLLSMVSIRQGKREIAADYLHAGKAMHDAKKKPNREWEGLYREAATLFDAQSSNRGD